MSEPRKRQIAKQLAAIAIATWITGSGCGENPQVPRATTVEFSAVQLIDYAKLPSVMNDILEDVFSGEIVGKPLSDYPGWEASVNQDSDTRLLRFDLPRDAENAEILREDQLAHGAWLWIRLETNGCVKSAELRELVF